MTSIAIGLSRDLAPNRVMRADVHGLDLAVWRGPDNTLHAWGNRCPHRGMRLSHGFVRGGRLACLYHGWQYRQDGGCAYIPAHPELEPPSTIHAQVFSVTEADGVIWVAQDEEAVAAESAASVPLRSLSFACSARLVMDAFVTTPIETQIATDNGDGTFTLGPYQLAIRLNQVSDSETQVHICVGAEVDLATQKSLSRWCEAVRTEAEAKAT